MNIKIKTFFILLGILISTLVILLIFMISNLYTKSIHIKELEFNRYLMTEKAKELRQSSDDLTRMARTYVVTNNKEYKQNYFKILDIRNGKVPRPQNYEGIYWDLRKQLRIKRHPNMKPISLTREMGKLPYSKLEYEKLLESQANSNKLVSLEKKSFKLLEVSHKQQGAIKLLYSDKYHNAKEQIMLPIDKFLVSLKKRTKNEIQKYNKDISTIFKKIFLLLGIGFILFIFTVFIISLRVLYPIKKLTDALIAFKNKKHIDLFDFYNDEMGILSKQFFLMKNKIEEDFVAINKLATHDSLTNILNRRAFFDIINQLKDLSVRNKSSLTLLMIDIDFFKKVNDTYGHQVGDKIIKHIVQCIIMELRESDICARYGGEEFIVALPETNLKGALYVAQNICNRVQETPFQADKYTIQKTVSIGISLYFENEDIEQSIERSDQALYLAKNNGRNTVEVIDNNIN